MMEFDRTIRATFDATLLAHVRAAFPEAAIAAGAPRWELRFPDGTHAALYEPNFFFSLPSCEVADILRMAARAVRTQRGAIGVGGLEEA